MNPAALSEHRLLYEAQRRVRRERILRARLDRQDACPTLRRDDENHSTATKENLRSDKARL